MSNNPINIVCATDDNYAPYCGVMLTSVFENNKEREIHAYILLDTPLSGENQAKFEQLSQTYNASIDYCYVDHSLFKKYTLRGYGAQRGQWSIVTYYRLLVEDVLPKDVHLALYLDCDIIVDSPLGQLFDLDWTNIAIGAVSDMSFNQKEFYDRLQYNETKGYFNAGVAMINLDYWRAHGIGKQCMEYLERYYDRIWNNDQDVLNAVLCDCKRALPLTYNYQIQYRMAYFYNTYPHAMQEEIKQTQHPIIIHYASELKPWMAYYYSYPFYQTWQQYKHLSPWRHMKEQLPKNRKVIAWIKRYMLWPLGIMLKRPELAYAS